MSEPHDDVSFTPADSMERLYTVDDVRTTAKRLAAYRTELIDAGFSPDRADELAAMAAPALVEDVVLASDAEDQGAPIGEVRVHLRPQINNEDVARIAQEIQRRADTARRF